MSDTEKTREQTDESLKVERTAAEAQIIAKLDAAQEQRKEVVRAAREQADDAVQEARESEDAQTKSTTPADIQARESTDARHEKTRVEEDKALDEAHAVRRRYLEDFLESEREATDKHLREERADADKMISARNEFLGTVSHDLRSLLTSLSLNATIMNRVAPEGAAGDDIRRHAVSAQRLVSRMGRLVSDLLDIMSMDQGKLAIFLDQVDVASLVRDTVETFGPIAAAKNITLDSDVGPLPKHADIDGERILQVLANLVSNGIKFTPNGGRVSIQVRVKGDELHFAICDTGIGIPDDALPQVFERFRQVSRDRHGLGLGLHISMGIIEGHGGRLWVTSKVKAGSTFHFTIPLAAR